MRARREREQRRDVAGGAGRLERTKRRYRTASKPRRGPLARSLRIGVGLVVVLALAVPAALVAGVATWALGPLPATLPRLPDATPSAPSLVVAADGSVLTELPADEQRYPLVSGQIPETAITALLAAEDHRFFSHGGVDPIGILRAGLNDLKAGRVVEGGSTITQQLVKSRTGDQEQTLGRKLKEAATAIRLERAVPHRDILTAYLNTAYFGARAYGIEAASRVFFGHGADKLTLSEAALLMGALPRPSEWSAKADPTGAEARRLIVLEKAGRYGLATEREVAGARAQVPVLVPPPEVPVREPYFVDYVKRWLHEQSGIDPARLARGGLRIETTLDLGAQAAATEAVAGRLGQPGDPGAAVVLLDPTTGWVRALVGGQDYAASQVNLALGAAGGGTGRQPGSTFKPFLLATAFMQGRDEHTVYNAPAQVQPPGFAKPVANDDRRSHGRITLEEATRNSVNTVFVQLIGDIGVQATAQTARSLGVSSIDPSRVDGSIAIGTAEVSVLDMASAYGSFAARGLHAEATPVARITDGDGNVLYDAKSPGQVRVLPSNVADRVSHLLEGVVQGGTGTGAQLDRPVAGKTGTTEDYADAWFVGYTPDLVGAVWVGYPDSRRSLTNIHGISEVFGGTIPAGIFRDTMSRVLAGTPARAFVDPGPMAAIDAMVGAQRYSGRVPTGKRALGPRPRGMGIGRGGNAPIPVVPPTVLATTTTTTTVPSSTTTTTTPAGSTTTTTTAPGGPTTTTVPIGGGP